MWLSKHFSDLATRVAHASGRPLTFILAILTIMAWIVSGPIFGYSDTWQLVINTGTTIVTFLMVFLIQNTQNRDGAAIQTKLDELIRASAAKNAFIGIEHLTVEELDKVRRRFEERVKSSGADRASQAADDAEESVNRKAAEAAQRAAS
jgi:low affinity Fe/Cu permease